MEPCTSSDDVVGSSVGSNLAIIETLRENANSLNRIRDDFEALNGQMEELLQQIDLFHVGDLGSQDPIHDTLDRLQQLSLQNEKLKENAKEESAKRDALLAELDKLKTEPPTQARNGKTVKLAEPSETFKGLDVSKSSTLTINKTTTGGESQPKSYFEKNSMELSSSASLSNVEGEAGVLSSFNLLMEQRHKNPAKSSGLSENAVKNTYACSELESILNPKLRVKDLTYEEALRKIDEEAVRAFPEGINKGTLRKTEGSRGQQTPSTGALVGRFGGAVLELKTRKDDASTRKRGECKASVKPRLPAKTRKTSGQTQLDMEAEKFNNMFDDHNVQTRIFALSKSDNVDGTGEDVGSTLHDDSDQPGSAL